MAHWSLAATFLFSLVSLLLFSFLPEMKMRGSETSDQPTTVLDNRRSRLPRVPLLYLHRSSVNREDHLLMLYGHPPTSAATKAASETSSFGPVNIQIYILPCGAFHSLFSLPLSLSPTTPPFLALALSFSLPLFPSSSLVVRIHPTAEWLLCLCVCARGGRLSIWTPPSPLLCSELLLTGSVINMFTRNLQGCHRLHVYGTDIRNQVLDFCILNPFITMQMNDKCKKLTQPDG